MNVVIEATERYIGKNSELKNLRESDIIPGVIYGPGREPLSIQLDKNLFLKEYRKTIGELVIFVVKIGKNKFRTIIKDKQIHPLTREILHLDFLELRQDSKIKVKVPIKYVGTPLGVKDGGLLEILIREVEVTCLPKDIVEDVEIDITHLEIGNSIQVRELRIENVDIGLSPEVSLVILHPPKVYVEEEEEVGEGEIEGEEGGEEEMESNE